MKRMLPAASLAIVFMVSDPLSLRAQALPTATGPGTSVSAGLGFSSAHIDYGQRRLGGYEGWLDVNPWWWGGLEVQGQSLVLNQDLGTHAFTVLAGPRIALSAKRAEPYIKVLAGRGTFIFPYHYARGSYFVISGGVGLDLHLGRHLQWRVVDAQYQAWPDFTFGSMRSYGFSSGLSLTLVGARHHGKAPR